SGAVRLVATDSTGSVYANSDNGLFKSTDGGVGWIAVNSGLTLTQAFAVATHPVDPNTLYAGTRGGGVFKTVVGSTSWTASFGPAFVYALAVDPGTPSTVYAGTALGVFKTV